MVGNATLDPLVEILKRKCGEYGVAPHIFLGGFNQYTQEILARKSTLYDFNPEIIILALSGKALFENIIEGFTSLAESDKKMRADAFLKHTDVLIKTICKRTQGIVLLHNFVVPSYPPSGILDVKQKMGLKRFFECLNLRLENKYRNSGRVYLFDVNECVSFHGKSRYADPKMYFLAKMEFSWDFYEILAAEYLRYILPLTGLNRKCLVVDLDNTLWGGVIGEAGIHGIRLGHDPPGNAYLAFQKRLLDFYRTGVLLAVSSRNNYEDAIKVIREHPDMLLREKYFSEIIIDWRSKPEHLKDIASGLNIGLDSLAFFDDDPRERECVKSVLPEVLVVDVPDDPSRFAGTADTLVGFEKLKITEEDKTRGRLYADARSRKKLKSETRSLDEFLHSLDMRICVSSVNPYSVSRASQLTQRTNQFNLTTRRYTEGQIKKFLVSKSHLMFSLRAKDKFGDLGMVGLCIISKSGRKWSIDAFLLSCRALGRGLEQAFLHEVIKKAEKDGVTSIEGECIPTGKNAVCHDFYEKNGFESIRRGDKKASYSLLPSRSRILFPPWIKMVSEDNHE